MRKPHDETMSVDLSKPFDYKMLGTADDPCFGKHFDEKAPECKACGDREICAVVMSQKLNLLRAKVTKDMPVMDKELPDGPDIDKKKFRKELMSRIGSDFISLSPIYKELMAEFDINEAEVIREVRLAIKVLKKTKNIVYNKKRTKVRWNKD